MLCGLPVVSTKSRGGRHKYYDNDFCLIVDDDPQSVNAGVQELIKRNIPPEFIRNETIKKLKLEREGYVEKVEASIRPFEKRPIPFEIIKDRMFYNPMDCFVKSKDYDDWLSR